MQALCTPEGKLPSGWSGHTFARDTLLQVVAFLWEEQSTGQPQQALFPTMPPRQPPNPPPHLTAPAVPATLPTSCPQGAVTAKYCSSSWRNRNFVFKKQKHEPLELVLGFDPPGGLKRKIQKRCKLTLGAVMHAGPGRPPPQGAGSLSSSPCSSGLWEVAVHVNSGAT